MTTLSQEALEKSLKIFNKTIVGGTLFTLDKLLNVLGTLSPKFKKELAEHNITVQLRLRDNTYGRWFRFKDGFVTGQDGINKDCIVEMVFEDEASARRVTALIRSQFDFVNAAKQGQIALNGPDAEAMWFRDTGAECIDDKPSPIVDLVLRRFLDKNKIEK